MPEALMLLFTLLTPWVGALFRVVIPAAVVLTLALSIFVFVVCRESVRSCFTTR
jgi:hypothetical protein